MDMSLGCVILILIVVILFIASMITIFLKNTYDILDFEFIFFNLHFSVKAKRKDKNKKNNKYKKKKNNKNNKKK